MSQPYVGQIILVGFTFAPIGWAFCDGSILAIAQNSTLFQLIGTTYGGDGQSTFGLPDLRGRVPIGTGQGAGLSPRIIGESAGTETIPLTSAQMPLHTHVVDATSLAATPKCKNGAGNQRTPVGNVPAVEATGVTATYSNAAPDANMNSAAIAMSGNVAATPAGGSQAHSNVQPYLTMNYCISLFGIFPSQL